MFLIKAHRDIYYSQKILCMSLAYHRLVFNKNIIVIILAMFLN